MRITLLTTGTRGDVNSFIALALGLREWGHQVRVAASRSFAASLKSIPIDMHALPGCDEDKMASVRKRRWLAANEKSHRSALDWLSHDRRLDLQRELMDACRDSDVLIFHPAYLLESAVVSEYLQKPLLFLYSTPFKTASDSRLLQAMTNERRKKADVNEWRARLGLKPYRRDFYRSLEQQKVPVLHAYSPTLAPFNNPRGSHHYLSGTIKSNKHRNHFVNIRDADELKRWLDGGVSAPIFFGMDRMPIPELTGAMTAMVAAIAKQLNTRAIIAAGGMSVSAENLSIPKEIVYIVPSVDHGWLFPRCSCVIHHGGTELTHLAAESGIPSLVCSTYADESFWGERLAVLGIGRHIPFSRLTQEKLLTALRELRRESVRALSEKFSRRVQSENGLQHALEWLEQQWLAAPVYYND